MSLAEARPLPDEILAETKTGLALARMLGGRLVFDADSLAGAKAEAGARSERDEPKLCPDPSSDVPHGASERAKAYQEQISRLNNPQRPLPAGMAVSLENPLTGKNVAFDDRRESDGTMIEAKGPGYAKLLLDSYMSDEILPDRWQRQAERQIAAAGSRDVEWFFAEPEAAAKAREWFADNRKLRNIKIFVIAPEGP